MIGDAGEALLMRIADGAGMRGEAIRQKSVVYAKAVASSAKPRIFVNCRIAAAPQVAEPDLCDFVHVMRGLVDGAGFVEIGPTAVEISDRQSVLAGLPSQGLDQRL